MQAIQHHSKQLNVLLIEDNANDAEFFENHLHKLRDRAANVETCVSLTAGLDRLSQGGMDIVFLDLTLPDSSGLHTLARTQKHAPTIPIIVLTGHDDDDLASDALAIGAEDFLVKGHIDHGALGRSINYAIGRHHNAETADWLRAVVESSNDAIYAESMDGVIRSWNQGAQRIYGYSASEAIGKTIELVASPGCNANLIRERVKRGESVENYESTRRRKDGTDVVVSVSAGAIKNAEGEITGISLTARDMTRQRLDEEALKETNQRLKESEQSLRLALDSAEMGIWDLDMATGNAWRSLKHDQLFGYEQLQSDWNFKQSLTQVVREDRAELLKAYRKAATGHGLHCEFRIVNLRDKAIHWLCAQGEVNSNVLGKPMHMMGVLTDITARKKEEQRKLEAAKHGEQLAHSIVQNAPVGIVTLNASLHVTDSNNAFAAMIHRYNNQLFNASLADILPLETFQTAQAALKKNKPLQLSRQKVIIVDHGAELVRYWDMAFWPIATEDGALREAVLQIIDCTDTVNLEEQQDDFVAAIAHDIKNPLIGAQLVLTSLCSQTDPPAPEAQLQMMSILRDSNDNLLNLVQNLVDVYHYQTMTYPVHYQAIDLKILVSTCLQQLENFAKSREVTLRSDVPESIPIVQADEVSIRRVLMNLLHNGIKFNRQGGITTISLKQLDGSVQIDVGDTGDGMDQADQKRLFQRFSQGKAGSRITNGTGLGLYLCKQIMLAHHGTITCESAIGRGSVFSANLPLVPSAVLQSGR